MHRLSEYRVRAASYRRNQGSIDAGGNMDEIALLMPPAVT